MLNGEGSGPMPSAGPAGGVEPGCREAPSPLAGPIRTPGSAFAAPPDGPASVAAAAAAAAMAVRERRREGGPGWQR